ncbi:nickel/cobalt transporter [Falsirhodobacter halotolerans]|uniref:nickel/cobalt transporter n=1 Tax=Falsirhodobacter halotolerans TaxID=1146892 RepID=UPI001FD3FCA6|nr:hypothetical protein [Falsirhodobacter halotolerans]MCJ8140371.1 hypothetical protein [Falsirhodobacter halotolerans]
MRLTATLALILLAVLAVWWLPAHWPAILGWANALQFDVQTAMAGVIREIRGGSAAAFWTLVALSGAYGFIHALGPGHGKVLLGGAAMGTRVQARRIFAIGVAASMAQALAAILLVGVVIGAFALTSRDASAFAEGPLATASRIVIGLIGALLIWRGVRAWRARPHIHTHACGCGHAHGPTKAEVDALTSPRDIAVLIASVAARPCTGAIFLLAIAWRFGIPWAGVAGVLAMGVGTALFNAIAIGGGLTARRLAAASGDGHPHLWAGVQIATGAMILALTALTRL